MKKYTRGFSRSAVGVNYDWNKIIHNVMSNLPKHMIGEHDSIGIVVCLRGVEVRMHSTRKS